MLSSGDVGREAFKWEIGMDDLVGKALERNLKNGEHPREHRSPELGIEGYQLKHQIEINAQ